MAENTKDAKEPKAAKAAEVAASTTKKVAPKKAPAAKAASADKPAAAKADKPAAAKADKPAAAKAPAKATTAKAPAADAEAADKPATTASTKAKAKAPAEGAGGTLKMHHLRPAPGAHTAKVRVGRGEAGRRGKTAGRGTKGQKARYQVPERFEGGQMPMHMRLPKLRGFKNPFRTEYQVVNLDRIASLVPQGGRIDPDTLADAGAVRRGQPVKVLGTGELGGVIVHVHAHAFSQSAQAKIGAAGGSTTQI